MFTYERPYALLAHNMGGMKTAQAIIGAQLLAMAGTIKRVVVVTPASVRPVWVGELGQLFEQLWLPGRITEFHARDRVWEFTKYESHDGTHTADGPRLDWIVTNYEYIRRDKNLEDLFHYADTDTLLVLDESSAVKNYDSDQTKAVLTLRRRCGRVLLLNGMPIADNPGDLFAQANIMHPSILECRYITHFRARYAVMGTVVGGSGRALVNPRTGKPLMKIVGWQHLDDLTQRLAPFVLRREAAELGINFALPAVPIEVKLTPTTWRAYREMRDEMVIWLESGDVATAHMAAVRTIRLAQITSGFVGGVEHDPITDDSVGDSGGLWDLAGGDGGVCDLGTSGPHPGHVDGSGSETGGIGGTAGGQRAGIGEIAGHGTGDVDATRNSDHHSSPHHDHGPMSTDFPSRGGAGGLSDGQSPGDRIHQPRPSLVEIGREKLDALLSWQEDLLSREPNLKLLVWFRFVPELRRYLAEAAKFGHPLGAVCGQPVFTSIREDRENALRLLHPRTAPAGPATVAGIYGTGAMGLNFTACHTVVDASYDFSNFKKQQGDARVNRPGQTQMVRYYYLLAVGPRGQKTIDHHIMLERTGKADLANATVAGWVRALREE